MHYSIEMPFEPGRRTTLETHGASCRPSKTGALGMQSIQHLQTNHHSSHLQVRGLVSDDQVDLYHFKAARDSAVHFVAFWGKAYSTGLFGVLPDMDWRTSRIFSRTCAFRLARRSGSRFRLVSDRCTPFSWFSVSLSISQSL
jgi:hypothetical protein